MGRRPQPGAAGWREARRPAEHASATRLDDAHVVRGSAASIPATFAASVTATAISITATTATIPALATPAPAITAPAITATAISAPAISITAATLAAFRRWHVLFHRWRRLVSCAARPTGLHLAQRD